MSGLSTAAWIGHDLGLATGVGGALFGRMALHPATRNISDDAERGLVISDAWQRFNMLQVGSAALAALTWFTGRSQLSGREVDSTSRVLTVVKDVLIAGTFGTAVGSAVLGRRLAAQSPGGAVPVSEDGQTLSAHAPEQAKKLNAVLDKVGLANLLCGAGVVAITAVLAMRAGESGRWSFISRLLP